jgi:hypothetical protein
MCVIHGSRHSTQFPRRKEAYFSGETGPDVSPQMAQISQIERNEKIFQYRDWPRISTLFLLF